MTQEQRCSENEAATRYNMARLLDVMAEILEHHPDDLEIPVVEMVSSAAYVARDIVASYTLKVNIELRMVEARFRKLADWPECGPRRNA